MISELALSLIMPFCTAVAPDNIHPVPVKASFDFAIRHTVFRTATDTASTFATADSLRSNLIAFAQGLKGTRYKYASASPKAGFDCSGFVKYVFNHFNINVPRTSVDFTNVGKTIDLASAAPGDVILFTGTNAKLRRVGHVGIITQSGDSLVFIHAASGKTRAVTETQLNKHYKLRFIKVVRVLH